MESLNSNRFFKTMSDMKFYAIVLMFMGFCVAYLYSYYYKVPMYSSSAVMVLVQDASIKTTDEESTYLTQSDIALNKNLLSTYVSLAKSENVLEKVISNLNLNMTVAELAKSVSLKSINNTEVIELSVVNADNRKSVEITNQLVTVFSEEIKKLYNIENVFIMDYAEISYTPYNLNHVQDLTIGAVLGLISYIGIVALFYIFDSTVSSEKDIENFAHLNVIASIPTYNKMQKNELIVNTDATSPISEAFKICRTNIMFSNASKNLNSILITSASPSEGKSFISSNLALSFAKLGKKVILIDTDMRNGRIERLFEIEKTNGLSELLTNIVFDRNNVNINEYIKETKYKNLHIITSGNTVQNPSELLSSQSTIDLIETLKTKYDIVICDGTPCTLVSDSVILSKIIDYSVLVASHKYTNIETIKKVNKAIKTSGGKIDGAILNKLELTTKDYKNKYYSRKSNRLTTIELEEVNHDSSLDEPLYVIKHKKIEKKVETKIENIEENTSSELTTVIEKLNYLSEANTKLSKKLNSKIERLEQKNEIYKENIENINNKIETINTEIADKIEKLVEANDITVDEKIANIKETINTEIADKIEKLVEANDIIVDEKIANIKEAINMEIADEIEKLVESNDTTVGEKIRNIKETINTEIADKIEKLVETNDITVDEKIANIKETINIEIDEKIEDIKTSNNDFDQKINEVIEPIIVENTQLKEKLEFAITSEQNNLKQMENLQNLLSLLKDFYENKFIQQEEYMMNLELEIKKLHDKTNMNKEIITNYVEERREPAKIIKIQDYIQNDEYKADVEEMIKGIEEEKEEVKEEVLKEVIEESDNIEKIETEEKKADIKTEKRKQKAKIAKEDKEEIISTDNKEVALAKINEENKTEEKVIRKGIFSFMKRNKYIKEMEELEENVEIPEPVSQILSIG